MKKILTLAIVVLAGLLSPTLRAQTVTTGQGYILFTAQNGEVFSVYVDGMPTGNVGYAGTRQQVTLTNLQTGVRDIAVRLIRPTDRLAHLTIDYQQQPLRFEVAYSEALGRLVLLAEGDAGLPGNSAVPTPIPAATPGAVLPPGAARHMATNEDVQDLVNRINKTSFENDKLQLAKSFVKGKWVTTDQAVLIAKTLRFESKRLEFLLYAFDYCTDRENYYTAVDVLTFNSNRQKLLKRIETATGRRPGPRRR